jgi:hypothetical protein
MLRGTEDASRGMKTNETHITLAEIVALLKPQLPDDFSRLMLDGALRVLADPGNPVRLHLFAPAVREMMKHTLGVLAPNAEITACGWYVPHAGKDKIWRIDRASYIIRAGLLDAFVKDELDFELEETTEGLNTAVEELNNLTHVKPTSLRLDEGDIAETVVRILEAFVSLLERAAEFREQLSRRLIDHCPSAVFDASIGETILEIDELASRYSIEWPSVHEVRLVKLSARAVEFEASGEIYATLEWGRGDDYAEMSETFPFTIILRASASRPFEVVADRATLKVDNSGWYGVDDDYGGGDAA